MAREKGTSVEELRRELAKKTPAPVYLVEGEEPVLAAEAVSALIDAGLPAAARDFNLAQFSGDDETGRQFLGQARSYPFLADRRVVVVRRFDRLKLQDRDEAAFLEYLDDPPSTTMLVLVATKLDRRFRVAQALDRKARVVSAAALPDAALPEWVAARFKARGVAAGEDVCRRLVALAGPSLLDLGNEIEKICARYPETKRVDVAQVDATAGRHRLEEVWAISRAFRPDNCAGVMQALSRVLEAEDEPYRLTALLARQVNDLLRMRILLDAGVRGGAAIAGKLRKNPWQVEQNLPQAMAFTREQLALWLRNLQRADAQMKSLRLPPRWTLERALLNSFLGREMA